MNENVNDFFPMNYLPRRKLLPWWIKIFCWIFMLIGGENCLSWIVRLSLDHPLYVNLFSNRLDTTVLLLSPCGILLGILVLFKAYVGYALWFGKNNALKMAEIDVLLSILASVVMMWMSISENEISYFWFEILFLIPYYLKISSLEKVWK